MFGPPCVYFLAPPLHKNTPAFPLPRARPVWSDLSSTKAAPPDQFNPSSSSFIRTLLRLLVYLGLVPAEEAKLMKPLRLIIIIIHETERIE